MAQKITVLQALDKSLRATKTYVDNIASNKVDKVNGKGLSTNDFTDELKFKYETL